MQNFYDKVLKYLNPEEIYNRLDNSILLCYEEHDEFCHRHIVAIWLELSLGVEVPEVKINGYDEEVFDRPEYIKEYIAEIMKNYKAKVKEIKK